jgi:DNA-binding NarL/FixJ family response regulator
MDLGFMLMVMLAVMDLAVFGVFIFFMKKMKAAVSYERMQKAAEVFESLLADSGNVAEQWTQQLEKKQELMRHLKEQMDERVTSLTLLCARAESFLKAGRLSPGPIAGSVSLTGRENKIIALARNGRNADEIASRLALPREEVKLVLGLEKKLSRLGTEDPHPLPDSRGQSGSRVSKESS